jgi:hypothetical protein
MPSGKIRKISFSEIPVVTEWASGLNGPFGLAIYESNMYVSNFCGEKISQINLSNGNIINSNWATGLESPMGLVVYNSHLYVTNLCNETISKFALKKTPDIPIANICFPANTPILTDQETIAISKINPNKHTINNKPIIDVTKTITGDDYLVCFEKNSLKPNYPSEKTIISKHHKIYYKGKMIEAYKFIENFKNVHKIKYNGEILYNVLMKEHYIMNVNNLICETLHPNNIIAKLHTQTSKYNDDIKDLTIMLLNEYTKCNDFKSYNKLVKNC